MTNPNDDRVTGDIVEAVIDRRNDVVVRLDKAERDIALIKRAVIAQLFIQLLFMFGAEHLGTELSQAILRMLVSSF